MFFSVVNFAVHFFLSSKLQRGLACLSAIYSWHMRSLAVEAICFMLRTRCGAAAAAGLPRPRILGRVRCQTKLAMINGPKWTDEDLHRFPLLQNKKSFSVAVRQQQGHTWLIQGRRWKWSVIYAANWTSPAICEEDCHYGKSLQRSFFFACCRCFMILLSLCFFGIEFRADICHWENVCN